METCKDIPNLKLNVRENPNDAYRLLKIIKPDWDKDQVKIKVFPGGYSCTMLLCSHDSGDSVTVRVRKLLEGLKKPLHERLVVKAMSAGGHFPPILATFQNGYCYEYIPGNAFVSKVSTHLIIDEDHLRLIAEQMASIHTVIVPEFDYTKTPYFDFFFDLLSTSKPWFEGCPSIEELNEELRMVKELVSIANSPLVLCHSDPHPANFVWNEEQQKVTFVDWELVQIAPRAVDVAYFLNSMAFFGHYYNIPVSTPDDMERKFCDHYLQRWNTLQKKPPPTTDEINQLLLEVKYFSLMVRLSWVIYLIKFDLDRDNFGPVDSNWRFTIERYLHTKQELLGLKKLGHLPS